MNTIAEDASTMEGWLCWRKGKFNFKAHKWKQSYVVLHLLDGGSIAIYNISTAEIETKKKRSWGVRNVYSASSQQEEKTILSSLMTDDSETSKSTISRPELANEGQTKGIFSLIIPSEINWTVTDIENNSSCFVVEIPLEVAGIKEIINEGEGNCNSLSDRGAKVIKMRDTSVKTYVFEENSIQEENEDDDISSTNSTTIASDVVKLRKDISNAQKKGVPLRFFFRGSGKGNEKALWLQAFSKLNRLSYKFRKRNVLGSIQAATKKLSRHREPLISETEISVHGKIDSVQALDHQQSTLGLHREVDLEPQLENEDDYERGNNKKGEKEFRVQPPLSYPHQWATKKELIKEMISPSDYFFDSTNPFSDRKVIGTLQIEVLQCLCLPKLERFSEIDAVVYLVCGPYAFSTDVIENQASPMWLPKSRRANTFPIHHAYSRLYVGVFDNRLTKKDELAGRVVVDLSRLRPGSTYDVTLQLRLSTQVYATRQRGAIRLRMKLTWDSQRSAVLSYLPQNWKFPKKLSEIQPRDDTTIVCANMRSFRNVAITIYGSHMTGQFSFQKLRATTKEFAFTRKMIMVLSKKFIGKIWRWENPVMSAFVFLAWMDCCVARNSFALVPAYVLLFIWLQFMTNYCRYGMDNQNQNGLIPPSIEEIMMSILCGNGIKPLEMGCRQSSEINNGTDANKLEHVIRTHEYKAGSLFRFLGMDSKPDDLEERIGEFPFSNALQYPRLRVEDSLCGRRKDYLDDTNGNAASHPNADDRDEILDNIYGDEYLHSSSRDSEIFCRDQLLSDDEEDFDTNRMLRKAAATTLTALPKSILNATNNLTHASNLHHVVSPLKDGLNHVAKPIRKSIIGGVKHMKQDINYMNKAVTSTLLGGANDDDNDNRCQSDDRQNFVFKNMSRGRVLHRSTSVNDLFTTRSFNSSFIPLSKDRGDSSDSDISFQTGGENNCSKFDNLNTTIPSMPEQNIDIVINRNKKLTDEFAEINYKVHELTFHSFNDTIYTLKHPDACYFGDSKKYSLIRPTTTAKEMEEERKEVKAATIRKLNKLLKIGKYSHSNPVIAHVALYVEPMIGAAQSFLCAFRAFFNIFTWRDPFLSFWVAAFTLLLIIILFIFPWRLFLTLAGLVVVGPQNYIIFARKRDSSGSQPRKLKSGKAEDNENINEVDTDESCHDSHDNFNSTSLNRAFYDIDEIIEDFSDPEDEEIFHGHSLSRSDAKAKAKTVTSRELHHVVVPDSRLMYQRFYDWPPDPKYAQVKADHANNSIGNQFNDRTTTEKRFKPIKRRRRPVDRMAQQMKQQTLDNSNKAAKKKLNSKLSISRRSYSEGSRDISKHSTIKSQTLDNSNKAVENKLDDQLSSSHHSCSEDFGDITKHPTITSGGYSSSFKKMGRRSLSNHSLPSKMVDNNRMRSVSWDCHVETDSDESECGEDIKSKSLKRKKFL